MSIPCGWFEHDASGPCVDHWADRRVNSNAHLCISWLVFLSIFSKPFSVFGNLWKELLNRETPFWLHFKWTSQLWLCLCAPLWSLLSHLWWLHPGPCIPVDTWGILPGILIPSFFLSTVRLCWLPLMKYSSEACLVPSCFLPCLGPNAWLTTVGCFCEARQCTLLCFLARSSACYIVETLKILAEWIQSVSEWGYSGSLVCGRGWFWVTEK